MIVRTHYVTMYDTQTILGGMKKIGQLGHICSHERLCQIIFLASIVLEIIIRIKQVYGHITTLPLDTQV